MNETRTSTQRCSRKSPAFWPGPCVAAWSGKGAGIWSHRPRSWPRRKPINTNRMCLAASLMSVASSCVQAQVRPTPLYEAYKAWCEQNGERYETMRAIGIKLTERGFEKRNNHGAVYLGLGLRSQDND